MKLKKKIDWEQRRYEMVKEAFPMFVLLDNMNGTDMKQANEDFLEDNLDNWSWEEVVAARAIDFVDEVLRQLKHRDPRIDKKNENYYIRQRS
jgi:hypothetical protein